MTFNCRHQYNTIERRTANTTERIRLKGGKRALARALMRTDSVDEAGFDDVSRDFVFDVKPCSEQGKPSHFITKIK